MNPTIAMKYHLILLVVYSVDVDLIPHSNANECPMNTQYKNGFWKANYRDGDGSCSCEDHCGWDVCRLVLPPTECVDGAFSEWKWDYVMSAWVAQVTLGTLHYVLLTPIQTL